MSAELPYHRGGKGGARPSDQALAVPVEPASGLAPSGFDPSRGEFFRGLYIPSVQRGGPDLLGEIEYSAVFDGPNDEHRLELRRIWDETKPLLVVCMTNPSRASHLVNDPTVLVLIHFGKLWGYGGLLIVNGATWRSSSPAEMLAAAEPESGLNWWHLQYAIDYAKENGGIALAAWGNDGASLDGCHEFAKRAANFGVTLVCLGTTADGNPKHPMARGKHRIARDQQPIIWNPPSEQPK